jgi:hypothetical protein
MRNSSVEAMQDLGSLLRLSSARLLVMLRIDECSAPNQGVYFVRPKLVTGNVSFQTLNNESVAVESEMNYYVSMTARLIPDNLATSAFGQRLAQRRFRFACPSIRLRAARSTPTLCGYLSAKSFGFPGSRVLSQGRPIPWQLVPDKHPPAMIG